ncbi:hypothetical protein Syun_012984 [Stephania yunnanensis]|uniref:Uncharacterized protein n=1 Tax=Stephania yunnanensis TaxID=152371 RepID=A0AAP0K167_9MAGN
MANQSTSMQSSDSIAASTPSRTTCPLSPSLNPFGNSLHQGMSIKFENETTIT